MTDLDLQVGDQVICEWVRHNGNKTQFYSHVKSIDLLRKEFALDSCGPYNPMYVSSPCVPFNCVVSVIRNGETIFSKD